MTSHRAANTEGRFWKKDGLVEEKIGIVKKKIKKAAAAKATSDHKSNTFQFESMTSSARNVSYIVLCHMEVVKNWSKTFSNAALKNFSSANTVFQSWH